MRDNCVYRSDGHTTPVRPAPPVRETSSATSPLRVVRLLQAGLTPAKPKLRPIVTGTPKKEVVALERKRAGELPNKDALILKDWVKSHLAMKRHMRHPKLRNVLEFKNSREIEHQNMFNFLSRTYVSRYKDWYEQRLGLFLQGKPLPRHCLTQSPGTCVLFAILNLYLVHPAVFDDGPHLPFVEGLCAALHPFPDDIQLIHPETQHMLSHTQHVELEKAAFENEIQGKSKKNDSKGERLKTLLQAQFKKHESPDEGQQEADTKAWATFEEQFQAFLNAYGKYHKQANWKDGERNLDSLNFSYAVYILLPKFSIHTIQPTTSSGVPVTKIDDLMTLGTFLVTASTRGERGCVLVQSDAELLDKNGNRRKVSDEEVKQARETQIRDATSTEAAQRHTFMYSADQGTLRVYDPWDGTISTWGIRQDSKKWYGLGNPETWIVYAYAN